MSTTPPVSRDLLSLFVYHPVAANLLMILMILAGLFSVSQLNTQFFPNFELEIITVRVVWFGATAEDVEASITSPLERELRNLNGVRKITSTSANGVAAITLEYIEGADVRTALDEVKQRVDAVRNLPSDAETPEVNRVVRYESIADVMLVGGHDRTELRHLARQFERELLARGISRIIFNGLPDEEIAIQVPTAVQQELGMSLPDIARQLDRVSQDLPAGTVGRDDVARQLRSLDQRRDEQGFADLTVKAADGRLVRVMDIATITQRPKTGEVTLSYQGKPAIELELLRTEGADSLQSARILKEWLEETRPRLPPGVELVVFNEAWKLINDRLMLLVNNGMSGLILVVVTLILFLNSRVTFWVAADIPMSFLATMAVLYLLGGSINMISMFALIMMLGIVVDDATVVGEEAWAAYQRGVPPLLAAERSARRMFIPVVASSLTTIAAFIPLMMIGGRTGKILIDIPIVTICVLIVSLIECFLILPSHLGHSFTAVHRRPQPPKMRRMLDDGFAFFRDRLFRPAVTWAVDYRFTTIALAMSMLILAFGLLASGRINFTFFPTPENPTLFASASFVAGSPPAQVSAFLAHVEQTARDTEAELIPQNGGRPLIVTTQVRYGEGQTAGGAGGGRRTGDQYGTVRVELTPPDERTIRVNQFIAAWRKKVQQPAGIENFVIFSQRGGPPGRDLDVQLTGTSLDNLKAAALELVQTLSAIPGVIGLQDDLPYGKEQLIYRLTPLAEALGLTVESIGAQLRAAYDGHLVQVFQVGDDEVEVRVVLHDEERYRLTSLEQFQILLPNGRYVPLANVANLESRRGFEALRHAQGQVAVSVSADVDAAVNNANVILAHLRETVLPELSARYGLNYTFEGRRADQAETLANMQRGTLLGLALIYIVLAWVFGSYGWPLLVMTVIPLGLVGALFGHWLVGINLTILSLFGIFGLAGIVINNSIILVEFFKSLRAEGMPTQAAIIEATCQRLRAVTLTSLTTIGGLIPLLFERSQQAQFLIPMAVSIAFGLGFATLLVLFFIPALLSIYESAAAALQRWQVPNKPTPDQAQAAISQNVPAPISAAPLTSDS